MQSRILLLFVAGLLTASHASATVRNVPGDLATIQQAINVSSSGDTIHVSAGVFTENIDYGGKALRIIGVDGASATVLNPSAQLSTVRLANGEGPGTELAGLTITGGDVEHAIFINNGAQPYIHDNVIRDHVTYLANATAIGSFGSSPIIEYNLFVQTVSLGAIGIFSGGGWIVNNTFHNNYRGYWSQGSGVIAKNDIVTNSVQFGIGATGFTENHHNCVYNNHPNYDYGASPGVADTTVWPEYCDTTAGDYHLDVTSPCLGTGEGGVDRGAFPLGCGAGLGPRALGVTVGEGLITRVVDHTPEISWKYFDPDGLPQQWVEVEVGTDPEWTIAELWDPDPVAGADTSIDYSGSELIDATDYYLRVRVNNGTAWGAWTYRQFHMNGLPSTPSLQVPPNDASVQTTTPTLITEAASDPENDPLTYAFEVYSDAELTALLASAAGVGSAWAVNPALAAENQPHWWRVRAADGFEYGSWSDPRQFYLDAMNSLPAAGDLISPIQNAPVPTTEPIFEWSDATDDDPGGQLLYTLVIATDSAFTFSVSVPAIPISGYRYSSLSIAQRYWWKVKVTDLRGGEEESVAERFFIPGPGDMNMNQSINVVDVVMVVDVIFRGAPAPESFYLVDVNGDCQSDVRDVVDIVDHVFRGGPLPLSVCDQTPAVVIHVPADYPSISNAIQYATTDDTIIVAPGVYQENIDFAGKSVHVLSESGTDVTIIEPLVDEEPIIRLESGEGEGAELAGFTLRGGSAMHAILISNGSSPHVHGNVIRDHISYLANATEVGCFGSSPTLQFNLFIHNRSIGGIGVFYGGGKILNNTFDDNSRGYWSQGEGVIARNNVVTNSVQFGIGATGFSESDYNCVYNNNPNYDYGAVPGASDFSVDPMFCNPGADDYRLAPGSPCLGTGRLGADRGAFGAGCGSPPGGNGPSRGIAP